MKVLKIQDNKYNTNFGRIRTTKPTEDFLRENLTKDCFEKFVEIQKAELNNDITQVFVGLVGKTNWVNKYDFDRVYMKVYDKVFFVRKSTDYSNTFIEQLNNAVKYSHELGGALK